MTLPRLSPARIAAGDDYVEVYAMKVIPQEYDPASTDCRLIEPGEEADFYDIMVRPRNWIENNCESYAEFDDLSFDQKEQKIAELEDAYPSITIIEVP